MVTIGTGIVNFKDNSLITHNKCCINDKVFLSRLVNVFIVTNNVDFNRSDEQTLNLT